MKTLLAIASLLLTINTLAQEHKSDVAATRDTTINNQHFDFNDDGQQTRVVTTESGVETITMYSYYDNGTLAAVKCFRDGRSHGTWWTYADNGKATAMANYDNGQKTGTWLMWDEQGSQKTALRYDNGNRVACQEYSSNGEILMAGCQ